MNVRRIRPVQALGSSTGKRGGLSPDRTLALVAGGQLLATVAVLAWHHPARLVNAVAISVAVGAIAAIAAAIRIDRQRPRGQRRDRPGAIPALRALAVAVDVKDRYTYRHSERVAAYAAETAARLGLPIERIERLAVAATLHDVGKIAVPDAVLLKPGRLTAEEFELVTGHATAGERIVREVGETEIATWIRHHHERWDGDGYPDGLAGAAIPLESRILAVADAFDAMTTDRSYRRALSALKGIEQLRAHAGTQFDPRVASCLIELIELGVLRVHERRSPVVASTHDRGADATSKAVDLRRPEERLLARNDPGFTVPRISVPNLLEA